MKKKWWAFCIGFLLLLLGYWKFFYKTYSESVVAKNADCIIALDVKRVTNTLIWNVLTTPSQWKKISYSSGDKINWKDMIRIPDFVFIFHVANQPANAWYTVLDIRDEPGFLKGLRHYRFETRTARSDLQRYYSSDLGIDMIRYHDQILLGNLMMADNIFLEQLAREMFIQKKHITREKLFKNIEASSHLSMQVEKNAFLRDNTIMRVNFNKNKIVLDALLDPQPSLGFEENTFSFSSQSLCVAGASQPNTVLYQWLPVAGKEKISRAFNFNIDSLLLQTNQCYHIDIAGIEPRIDSAISYTYDDNFKPVEKVVVNKIMEPAFCFTVEGDSIARIYNYWNRNGQLEKTAAGQWFLPMPLVRSYCAIKNAKELKVISANYKNVPAGYTVKAIVFLRVLFTQFSPALQAYLPSAIKNSIANLESAELLAQKKDGKIKLYLSIQKKKNDLPIIKW